MKILHTVEFYHPSKGGAQEVVRRISELLVKRGHDVTVATKRLSQRTERVISGVKIQEFDVEGNLVHGITGEVEAYRDFVIRGGFDVVMSYAAQQWATDSLFSILDRIPCRKVLAPCGFSGLYEPAYESYFANLPVILGRYDHLIFHSNCYRDIQFCRNAGINRLSVIPNGASAEEFQSRHTTFRKRYGIPESAFLMLNIGSHTNWKGHAESIQAFSQARVGSAVMIINGNTHGSPGCLPHDWQLAKWTWLKSWGRKKVKLLDLPRPDVVALLQATDLFVFPSNIECSPIVLFEAMASQTPFISNDVGNAREIAEWSGGGMILPTRQKPNAPPGYCECSLDDLIQAMEDAAENRAKWQEMGKCGRKAWEQYFTWEKLAEQYESVYAGETVLAPAGRS